MHELFIYNDGGSVLPDGAFRLSPSQLGKFFDEPSNWYKEHVLGEEGFKGSTSTVLGTIVHAIAEASTKGITLTPEDVIEYIDKEAKDNPDVDADTIKEHWEPMGMAIVNHLMSHGCPERSEEFIYHELDPGYFPSGSCDGAHNGCIIDYKTTSALTAPKTIKKGYRLQLLAYAYLYMKQGIHIDRIKLIYVTRNNVNRINDKGKKLPDKPSVVTEVVESITSKDIQYIENQFRLIIDSVKAVKENPDLAYLIFKDYSLKDYKPQPKGAANKAVNVSNYNPFTKE